MSELLTLARPYAEAAFNRAKETGAMASWSEALAFLTMVLQDEALSKIIANPRVSKQQVSELMLEICAEQVQGEPVNFLKILIENNRLNLISQVAKLFEEHKAEDEGYINVEVFSAYALSASEKKKYIAVLENQLNRKVHATVSVDRSLIGGILAKAGDKVIDGSIIGQLNQLAKRL